MFCVCVCLHVCILACVCMHACLYVCICVYACMCLCVCVCDCQRLTSECLPQLFFPLYFEARSPTWTWSNLSSYSTYLDCPRIPLSNLGFRSELPCLLGIFLGAEHLNCVPHTCEARILLRHLTSPIYNICKQTKIVYSNTLINAFLYKYYRVIFDCLELWKTKKYIHYKVT